MALSESQLLVFRTALDAETDPELVTYRTNGQTGLIAEWYSKDASPIFWVWNTAVARADIYNNTSPDGTTWNWTTYKNQGATEQNAWVQMFMGDRADFSKANLRAGVAAIFTGSAQANQQRDHVLACGRRAAKRVEKLFATGTGSGASPASLVHEGGMSDADVTRAMSLQV